MPPPADRSSRFDGRVEDYERGRPGYPEALFDRILAVAGLVAGDVVADLGAGTGLASAPLLARGLRVVAVEPNAEMRAAAERRFRGDLSHSSVDGRAEATGLEGASVDLVLAAQAFHWFDVDAARDEARRILRPPGWAALVWNARRAGGTPFAEAYESLLFRHGTDYREVGHRGVPSGRLARFFGGAYASERLANAQRLDLDGLRARLLSSSYVPGAGAPGHREMLVDLERLFERHAEAGAVTIDYDVELFFGRLARG